MLILQPTHLELGDSSSRLGDTGSPFTSANEADPPSMDALFAVDQPTQSKARGAASLFGLAVGSRMSQSEIKMNHSSIKKWSSFPPFRFGVEFWDIDSLKGEKTHLLTFSLSKLTTSISEKNRLHSHTVWYAGSLFNVYVQVVRKKTSATGPGAVQLGVYLHRQSSVDPIPPASRPAVDFSEGLRSASPPSLLSTSAPSVRRLPDTMGSVPGSPVTASSFIVGAGASNHPFAMNSSVRPLTSLPLAPNQPYRDPRRQIDIYFSIACLSATGSAMTHFGSSPDVFTVSQSWGWKSSSLRTSDYLDEEGRGVAIAGKEVSFRATLVLGVV